MQSHADPAASDILFSAVASYFSPPKSILEAFPPDEAGLFDAVRRQTSAKALDLIAEADNYEISEFRAALQLLAHGEDFSSGLPWFPREVLSLTRWYAPGSTALEREACLFACAALHRWGDFHDNEEKYALNIIGPLSSCVNQAPESIAFLFATALTSMLLDLEDPKFEDPEQPDSAFPCELGAWGSALALTSLMTRIGDNKLIQDSADWFVELHKPMAKHKGHAFFIGCVGGPNAFHAMAKNVLDARPWPPELETVWSFLARPESSPQKFRRWSRYAITTAQIAPELIPSVWRIWKEILRGLKEKD
jgi:hypothetical protein